MPEIATGSGTQHSPAQKKATHTLAGCCAVVAGIAIVFAVSAATAADVQDKYTLKSPSGVPYADFRGYEDWAVVGPARTDQVLKIITANPVMIKAYKAGAPLNGQTFPEGSKIVKLQWKPKKSTEAPFVVDVADTLAQVFVMEKDSKRFAKNGGGWGYAVFNYDPATKTFSPDAKSLSDCGNACHTAVKAKDYIFHPYETR